MDLVWLIDVGYVTKASKGRGKLDYLATKLFLEEKFQVSCLPVLFNSVDASGVDFGLNQFYYTMKKEGFIVNLYKMEGGAQKQVDVAIGSYLVYHAMKGNAIVLTSGDIDFVPAIAVARMDDKEVSITLFTYNFGVSETLSAAASQHWFFEDNSRLLRK